MGDPSRYPEIRMAARFLYAMQWLPPDLRADYGLRQQWIDNNMTYLDALVLALLQDCGTRLLTPPKGVWEGPRAIVHLPRNTRCRFLSPPPCAFLASSPRAWEVCLFLC
eukprot:scaffold7723_cov100-Isochrysis_galbana.AAC.4